MSGGHFDYNQYKIGEIADSIEDYLNGHPLGEDDLLDLDSPYRFIEEDEYAYCKEHKHSMPNRYGYSEETIKEFQKGLKLLRMAQIYAQRIDWLLSGDDGEESFHERLKEDLEELKTKEKTK